MAELVPLPIGRLINRMFRELEQRRSIFDLPERKFVLGSDAHDLSVDFHGKTASTPLGPAAGPQSQLAQNIVLSFLSGGRIMELKTVQIMDELKIPRPCIDMQTVGYNVEWSQELKIEQSLDEYAKASMLLEILAASGKVALRPGFDRVLFDMSVGYDLKGIRTDRVQGFVRGMMDASAVVEKLRAEIPDEWKKYRDLPFATKLSDTLTLSTFHGCPPDEIEKIIDFLLKDVGLNCIVKLNPTLLGKEEARGVFNGRLGFTESIPDGAFDKDTKWEDAVGFVERLGRTADGLGLSFGVKFSNTLIVENRRDFFPKTEKEMYLSGPPLHVLAVQLVDRFRRTFGDRFPVSFSAGIDRGNFADAVAIGLCPVTVCSDLLRPGGYGRAQFYFRDLYQRMDACGATDVDELILRAFGHGAEALDRAAKALRADDETVRVAKAALAHSRPSAVTPPSLYERWISEAKVLNTRTYAARLLEDPRYTKAGNSKTPPKVGSRLELFNCITCDKCVPVCPNDANFTYVLPKTTVPVVKMSRTDGRWQAREAAPLVFDKKHQIGNFADFCNECGNCDVFCPEDGGPYVLKPRFFGSEAEWARWTSHDGFHLSRTAGRDTVLGRFDGRGFRLELEGGLAVFSGEGFRVRFSETDPAGTFDGESAGEVDLTYFHIMNWLRKALLDGDDVNYVNT